MKMDQNLAADNRRTIGSVVEAKACHVTSLAECARRYGAQKSTKYIEGVVVDINKIKKFKLFADEDNGNS
jgi:hypothetical protein